VLFQKKEEDGLLPVSGSVTPGHREGLPFEWLVLKFARPKIHKFYYSFSWNLKNNIPNSKIAKVTIKKDIDIFIFWYVKFWYPMSRLLLATYMLDLDR